MILNFIQWNPDPELFNILGFPIRYYSILFATAIISSVSVIKWIFKQEKIPAQDLDSLITFGVAGILLGARLGHCLFYDPEYYLSRPLEIFLPIGFDSDGSMKFTGYQGLASHGGALGLIIALIFYARKTKHSLLKVVDIIAVVTGLAAAFIRLANFANSEIIGVPTEKAWAIVFLQVDELPRHPAQLYEAISYLIIFGLLLMGYKSKKFKLGHGFFFGLYLSLTFSARFLIEFVKENQVGFEDSILLNMGQILSLPYIAVGVGFMVYALKKRKNLST